MIDGSTNLNHYNYFTEIEETFVRRRGKHLLLSPLDWALIENWQERSIPLHIVVRSIEAVFDSFEKNPRPRSIKGLLYCREEVEAQFVEWAASQAGKGDDETAAKNDSFSVESISEHIASVVDFLKQANNPNLRETYDRAILRLVELKANLNADFEVVDGSLSDVEKIIDQALLTKSDKMHLKKIKAEVELQLKAYKSTMEPTVYRQTFEMMLLKHLREAEGLPRLSLFFL